MNTINILLLILIILIIYGYFFNIKNNQILNIFENFNIDKLEDINDKFNLVNLNKKSIDTILDNDNIWLSRMASFATGIWTSNKSEIKTNTVDGIKKREVINNMSIFISVKDYKRSEDNVTYNNIKYPISDIGRGTINTQSVNNTYLIINFLNFTNNDDLNLPYPHIPGLPRCIVYVIGDVSIKFVSLKLINGTNADNVDNEILKIIKFGINESLPELDYDILSYKKLIGNYKYPNDAVKWHKYSSNIPSTIDRNKIVNIYNNQITFTIQRTYQGANNNFITTKMSQPFNITIEDNFEIILSKIRILNQNTEKKLNNISNKYFAYSVTLYFYKNIEYNTRYNYGNPKKNISSKSFLNPNSTLTNWIGYPGISYNKLDTLQKINESTYRVIKVGTYITDNSDNNLIVDLDESFFSKL
tara:strand:+ start:1446 stop:2693 length:1248 start_codon:yes stop_codon:yes gene_type:complete